MDPLSLAASIAGLAGLVASLVSTTYQYGSGVIGASSSQKGFLRELQSLRSTLQQLDSVVAEKADSSDEYSKVYTTLETTVAECQAEISELQGKLQRKLDAGKLKGAIYRLTWPLSEGETLKTVEVLARYRGLFQLAMSVDTWNLVSLSLREVITIRQKQESIERDGKSRLVVDWLSKYANNYHMKHDEVVRRRVSGTGGWLLQSEAFSKFVRKSDGGQLLWCHGIPGAGKTVLSSIVIDHLSSSPEFAAGAVLYCYFDYLRASDLHPDSICAMVLVQLVEHFPTLPGSVNDLYDRLKDSRKRPDKATLFPVILELLGSFEPSFVVLDALDECDENYRPDVQGMIEELSNKSVNIFVTSRPHIEYSGAGASRWTSLEIQGHKDDIASLFDYKLHRNAAARKLITSSLKEEVIDTVVSKADGMFLRATLQIDEVLRQKTRRMVLKTLENMPGSIFEVFDGTLRRIGGDDLALRTLFWLANSKDPLDFPALSHALSVDLDDPPENDVDLDNVPTIEVLVELCHGFVLVDGSHDLRFVHLAIQEYFDARPEKLLPLDMPYIARVCLSYLSLSVFESGYCDSTQQVWRRLRAYPFIQYAARSWSKGLPRILSSDIEEAALKIYCNEGLFSSYSQIFYAGPISSRTFPLAIYKFIDEEVSFFKFQRGYTPLHNALELELHGIASKLLESGANPSARTADGITPLHIAIEKKRADLVQLLLSAGADVLLRGKTTEKFEEANPHRIRPSGRKYYPATLAALLGHRDIVNMLAPHSDDTLSEIFVHLTWQSGRIEARKMIVHLLREYPSIDSRHPALLAVVKVMTTERAHVARANVLPALRIFLEERPDLTDQESLSTELLPHIIFVAPSLAKNLLDRGWTSRTAPKGSLTALQAAVECGHEDLAKALVENGADVSDVKALSMAAGAGMRQIVDLLLDKGWDVNATGSSFFTALSAATANRKIDAMELLLNRGADTEVLSGWRRTTALCEAAANGWVEEAKVLLRYGANVDGGSTMRQPIMLATRSKEKDMIALLLDHGAKINRAKGPTALAEAASNNRLDLCETLLAHGADPNLPRTERSPLMQAVRRNNDAFVSLLLQHGADPDLEHGIPRRFYPLEFAVWHGYEHMVRILLDGGANLHRQDGVCGSILHAAAAGPARGMVPAMLNLGAKVLEGDKAYGGVLAEADQKDFRTLIDNGADVNARGGKYSTVLQAQIVRLYYSMGAAVQHGSGIGNHLEAIVFLIENGADVNAVGGIYGSALQAAARTGDENLVVLLLKQGADANCEGGRYGSPLQAAAYRGAVGVVEMLLDQGADINKRGGIYCTALQAAAYRGHEAAVKALLERGADVNIQGGKYGNALRAARKEITNRSKVVDKILEDCGAVDDNSEGLEQDETDKGYRLFPYLSDDD